MKLFFGSVNNSTLNNLCSANFIDNHDNIISTQKLTIPDEIYLTKINKKTQKIVK